MPTGLYDLIVSFVFVREGERNHSLLLYWFPLSTVMFHVSWVQLIKVYGQIILTLNLNSVQHCQMFCLQVKVAMTILFHIFTVIYLYKMDLLMLVKRENIFLHLILFCVNKSLINIIESMIIELLKT